MPVRDRLGENRMEVPFSLLSEKQALINHHGQSLAHLAGRGGLSHDEAVAIMEQRKWHLMPEGEAARLLAAALAR